MTCFLFDTDQHMRLIRFSYRKSIRTAAELDYVKTTPHKTFNVLHHKWPPAVLRRGPSGPTITIKTVRTFSNVVLGWFSYSVYLESLCFLLATQTWPLMFQVQAVQLGGHEYKHNRRKSTHRSFLCMSTSYNQPRRSLDVLLERKSSLLDLHDDFIQVLCSFS